MQTEPVTTLGNTLRIRRARGFRLYTTDGRRILDLWQAGGRAILGHRVAGISTALKQEIDRGLASPLPDSGAHRRVIQALTRLLPDLFPARVLVFPGVEMALRHCEPDRDESPSATTSPVAAVPADPAFARQPAATPFAAWWRPFVPGDSPAADWFRPDSRVRYILPLLPDGGAFGTQVVLDRRDGAAPVSPDDSQDGGSPFGGAGIVSPVALTALRLAGDELRSVPDRETIELPGFVSAGPYLVSNHASAYSRIFARFLDAGILLSPYPDRPSIIPGDLSDGERDLLLRVAEDV